jgi:hypothetical protein
MDAQISDTSMGLMKALHFLQIQQRRTPKRKFTYEAHGTAVHGKQKITREQREEMNNILDELQALDPAKSKGKDNGDRIKELFKQLGKLPVDFVPVKRELRIDRSKTYPYRSKKRGG